MMRKCLNTPKIKLMGWISDDQGLFYFIKFIEATLGNKIV